MRPDREAQGPVRSIHHKDISTRTPGQHPGPRLKEITHVFRKDDPYLASDAVCGVRESLVTDWLQLAIRLDEVALACVH
jgi:hypothetical protein